MCFSRKNIPSYLPKALQRYAQFFIKSCSKLPLGNELKRLHQYVGMIVSTFETKQSTVDALSSNPTMARAPSAAHTYSVPASF
jgi:hypothetical protein